MKILMAILAAVTAFLKWLAHKNDPANVERKDRKAEDKEVEAAIKASNAGNEDEMNRILRKYLALPLICVPLLFSGCKSAPPVVYIPEGDKVISIEINGAPGWWVPLPVYNRMTEKIIRKGK
jgi:phosphoribosylcarboxyaminoimidazole (NCAIR) mutase